MKNTKEAILSTALELFNLDGLSKVTLRTIANKMGISQGNLNYHFKKRDDIIETLYFQLVSQIDEIMLKKQSKTVGLQSLLSLSSAIMESFYDYRFSLLDFVQVMRENKKISTHYLQLIEMRQEQFVNLFKLLVDNSVMRKEVLPNEHLFLYKRFQILGDFWISSAAVTH
ncbi:MAG: TetR/AcrR family transcriptional regulator [Cyclobacteriaceae bacterium]|nr:TetR/AcrR family transcriptional regulator [Cyclobacteriaceae bacterium]